MDWFLVIVRGYIVAAIITFGYATNADWETEKESQFVPGKTIKVDIADNTLRGVLCGMMWPLYLSYKLFQSARPKP
jgi:hypothetical protein